MKTVVLACETIAEEVRLAVHETNSKYPVIWIESGLHNHPDKLKESLQEELVRIENADYILLLFGFCGNALLGLVSGASRLVIPRVDDCISLLLGGNTERNSLNNRAMGYYLTKGWLQHENNLWSEYNYCLNKYGHDRTRQIYRVMLENYQKLVVINTGAYNVEDFLPTARQIAAELNLSVETVPGSLDLLRQALQGDWNDHFAIIEPGRPVNLENLGILNQAGQTG